MPKSPRIAIVCDFLTVMGGAENAVTLITEAGAESWPRMGKDAVARRLADRIAEVLK